MGVHHHSLTPLPPQDDPVSYEQLLRLRGLRATRNRINILRTLNRKGYHPTISQLYKDIKQIDPDYQHSALYSSLRELTNNGIVRMVMHPAGQECLDGWQTPHHNLICKGCGTFYDLEFDRLQTQPLAHQVQQLGFHISIPLQISLSVTCPTCLGQVPAVDPPSF
jgi:Fur family peroxide stress response transcriptional regulator